MFGTSLIRRIACPVFPVQPSLIIPRNSRLLPLPRCPPNNEPLFHPAQQFSNKMEIGMNKDANKVIDEHVAENSVAVFAKSYCKYSKKTKEFFAEKGIKFEYLDLDTMGSEGAEIQAKLLERTGQSTVPSVWVNGKFIGGCDATLKAAEETDLFKPFEKNI